MDEDKRPSGKRYRKMDTITNVFKAWEAEHQLFGHEGFQFFLLQKRWEKIVGNVMARESYISSYKKETLFVTVTNSVFMQQLYMMQADILQELAKDEFGKRFKEIRFIAGPRKKKYKTMTTLDPINRNIEKEQVMYNQTLSDKETQWIQQWVGRHVTNENIRESFAHMMGEVLKIRKGELAHGYHPCAMCGSLCPEEKQLCPACERKLQKTNQNRVTLLLKEHPHLTYQEVRQVLECDYGQYQKARDILIHRYKENIFHKFATEEEKRKLLAILLHKPMETITKEEARDTLRKMPQKWWK